MAHKILIILVSLLSLARLTSASTLTLEEAVQRALKSNHGIRSLRHEADSAGMKLRASKAQRFGSIFFSGGYRMTEERFIVYPIYKEALGAGELPFDDEYFYYSLTYSLPLYTGGKITESIKLSEILTQQKSLKLRAAVNDLLYNVKRTYLNILVLDQKLHSLETALEAIESLVAHIQEGVQAGKLANLDLLKAQAERENLLKIQASLKAERESLYTGLMNLMGENTLSGFTLSPVNTDEVINMSIPSRAALLSAATNQRSDLKLLAKQVKAQDSIARIKKAARLPLLTLNAAYHGITAQGIDFNRNYYTTSVNLSVPVFTFGRLKNESDSADAESRAIKQAYQAKKEEIRKEVLEALSGIRRARAVLNASRAEFDLAKEVERVERLKYLNGRGRIDDLLFAISKLLDAETGLFRARVDLFLGYEYLKKVVEGDLK